MLPSLEPLDAFNQGLVSHTHPSDWVSPTPASRYHLVVIGGGTAGLVTAAGAAGLGARVALVEKHFLGGDCLNFGCVPSKALIRSARLVEEVRRSDQYGVQKGGEMSVDFASVMERMRRIRSEISHHDSAQRFKELGVDVFLGEGRFVGRDAVEVGGTRLRFKKAVIATGTRAMVPEIPGLRQAGYLTNESVFSLTQLPPRLAVIGGGPIGCELAQCFARFGSQVTLFHNKGHVLDREDHDAADLVEKALSRDGIRLEREAKLTAVGSSGALKRVSFERKSEECHIEVDAILLATGRQPNVSGIGLEVAGVAFDADRGVMVDEYLRTSHSKIYACGDICSRYKFTHAADAMARLVIQNALFFGRKKASRLLIPWCIYTDPEVAQVGLTEAAARKSNVAIDVFKRELKDVDRARLDGETDGFVKILVARGTDRIVGATIVARHAGDLISEVTVAMQSGLGLGKLASVIHPYPTQAEAIKQCGDAYNRSRLTPGVKRLFQRWFSWA